jgi:hypothetical protein
VTQMAVAFHPQDTDLEIDVSTRVMGTSNYSLQSRSRMTTVEARALLPTSRQRCCTQSQIPIELNASLTIRSWGWNGRVAAAAPLAGSIGGLKCPGFDGGLGGWGLQDLLGLTVAAVVQGLMLNRGMCPIAPWRRSWFHHRTHPRAESRVPAARSSFGEVGAASLRRDTRRRPGF